MCMTVTVVLIVICRLREDTDPVSSTYQLSTAMGGATTPTTSGNDTHSEGEGFTTCHTKFGFTGVEEYNWNYLDQHICGYSDFEELGEVRNIEKMKLDRKVLF